MNHVEDILEKSIKQKEGEALRNDDDYRFVSAWENNGDIEKSKTSQRKFRI